MTNLLCCSSNRGSCGPREHTTSSTLQPSPLASVRASRPPGSLEGPAGARRGLTAIFAKIRSLREEYNSYHEKENRMAVDTQPIGFHAVLASSGRSTDISERDDV